MWRVSSFFVNRISQEFFSMFQFQDNYVIVHTKDISFYENNFNKLFTFVYLYGTHVQKKVGQYVVLVLGKNVTGEKIQDKTMGQQIIWGNGGQGWQGEQCKPCPCSISFWANSAVNIYSLFRSYIYALYFAKAIYFSGE